MLQKIRYIILLLLLISTICVNLRVNGTAIVYLPDSLSAGFPRLIEIIAILFIVLNIWGKRWESLKREIFMFTMLTAFIVLFKPYFQPYLRSSILIPGFLLISSLNIQLRKETLDRVLFIFYITVSVSSLFVLISSKVDLGIEMFWANEDTQRYIGFGQSLPYQACYSLYAIPLFTYFQKNPIMRHSSYINMTLLMICVFAIIMTGARTAYLILFILAFVYLRNINSKVILRYSIPFFLVGTWFLIQYSDLVFGLINARNDANIANGAGRFQVGFYSALITLSNPLWGISNYWDAIGEYMHDAPHAQNGYLELMFTSGIPLFLVAYHFLRKIYKKNASDYNYSCISKGMFIIFIVFMMSEILYYSSQALYPFLIIMGLIYAHTTNLTHK